MDTLNSQPIASYLKSHAPQDGGFSLIVLGASRSGKSSLLVSLLGSVILEMYNKYIPLVLTESPNSAPLKTLDRKVFPICTKGFQLELVNEMIHIGTTYKGRYRPVIVIDDCNTRNLRSRAVEDLILLRRNEFVTTLIATHYIKLITPAVRDSANFILLLSVNSYSGQDIISKMFLAPLLPPASRKLCREFFMHITVGKKGCFMQDCLNGRLFIVSSGSLYEFLPYFTTWEKTKTKTKARASTITRTISNRHEDEEEEDEDEDEFDEDEDEERSDENSEGVGDRLPGHSRWSYY